MSDTDFVGPFQAVKNRRELFKHKVQETKNNLLTENASDVLLRMQFKFDELHLIFDGIFDLTFDEVLILIAQEEVLGVECVNGVVTDEQIKEWILNT
jgi:hypothetical protein